MNLACQNPLGQITKEVGFGKTPPPPLFFKIPTFSCFLSANVPKVILDQIGALSVQAPLQVSADGNISSISLLCLLDSLW